MGAGSSTPSPPPSPRAPNPYPRSCFSDVCSSRGPRRPRHGAAAVRASNTTSEIVSVSVLRVRAPLSSRPFVTVSCVGGGAPARPDPSHTARTDAGQVRARFSFHFSSPAERPAAVRVEVWDDLGGGQCSLVGGAEVPLSWGGRGAAAAADGWVDAGGARVLVHAAAHAGAGADLAGRLSYTHLMRVLVREARGLPRKCRRPSVRLSWGLERAGTAKARAGAGRAVFNEETLFWYDERWQRSHRLRVEVDGAGVTYAEARDLGAGGAIGASASLRLRLLPFDTFSALTDRDLSGAAAAPPSLPSNGEVWLSARLVPRADLERELLSSLVAAFDRDGDGRLSGAELAAALGALQLDVTVDRLDDLVAAVDRDGNGFVDEDEVQYLVRRLEAESPDAADRILRTLTDPTARAALMAPLHDGEKLAVLDRATGLAVSEFVPAYVRVALRALATGPLARGARPVLRRLSERQGARFDRPESARQIRSFVRMHRINYAEAELPLDEYLTFNQFFGRALAPGARPLAGRDDTVAVSPADCRLCVFRSGDEARRLWVKGRAYSSAAVLGGGGRAAPFEGGPVAVARLAPQDYHRWHSPVRGRLGERYEAGDALYSVSPVMVRTPVDVFTENRRVVQLLESPEFGRVAVVAVGATMVGSVVPRADLGAGDEVERGEELGHFAFGGSTVLVFFERGRVQFDEDLTANSLHAHETLVRVRTSIGRVPGTAGAAEEAAEAREAEPLVPGDSGAQLKALLDVPGGADGGGGIQPAESVNFSVLMAKAEQKQQDGGYAMARRDSAPDGIAITLQASGGEQEQQQ